MLLMVHFKPACIFIFPFRGIKPFNPRRRLTLTLFVFCMCATINWNIQEEAQGLGGNIFYMTLRPIHGFIYIPIQYVCLYFFLQHIHTTTPSVIQVLIAQPNFWDDRTAAQKASSNLSTVKSQVGTGLWLLK